MKNYLFAPFKNDDEKVETFNYFKNYLPKGHRHEFIMFIGRLESTYDVIMSDLKGENESLQDQLKECVNDYDNDIKASYDLDDKHIDIIKGLEAEIKQYQSHVDKYGSLQYDELKRENESLKHELNEVKCGGINQ